MIMWVVCQSSDPKVISDFRVDRTTLSLRYCKCARAWGNSWGCCLTKWIPFKSHSMRLNGISGLPQSQISQVSCSSDGSHWCPREDTRQQRRANSLDSSSPCPCWTSTTPDSARYTSFPHICSLRRDSTDATFLTRRHYVNMRGTVFALWQRHSIRIRTQAGYVLRGSAARSISDFMGPYRLMWPWKSPQGGLCQA